MQLAKSVPEFNLTLVDDTSNLDFVIASYKKMYLSLEGNIRAN